MDLVDSKYITLLSSRLPKFKRVKPNLFNFRCPICGDSQKHKNKARGYFYQVKANTNFKCHNCGASSSFNNFLKRIDPTLHQQYTMEKFKEWTNTQKQTFDTIGRDESRIIIPMYDEDKICLLYTSDAADD